MWLWLKGISIWDFRLTELHTFFVFGKGDRQMGSQVNEKKREKERKKERKKRKKRGKEKETKRKKVRSLDEWIQQVRKTSFSLQSLLCKTLRSFAS